MEIERLNPCVFKLGNDHPAKRFLLAFIECRIECVGRELDPSGQVALDQKWKSTSDGRDWTFSAFAYGFLSFDIELDGFNTGALYWTDSEKWAIEQLPRFRLLMNECADAARKSDNFQLLELTDQVLTMLSLWEKYLNFRRETIFTSARQE